MFSSCLVSRFTPDEGAAYEYRAYDWRMSAVFLLVYAVAGAAAGLLAGVLLPKIHKLRNFNTANLVRAAATVSEKWRPTFEFIHSGRDSPFSPSILVVTLILVIAACVGSAGSGSFARGCRPFAAAWLPCGLYLGCQWLADWSANGSHGSRVTIYGLLLIGLLGAVAWFAGRFTGSAGFLKASLTAVTAAALACCAVTAALQPAPFTAPEAVKASAAGRPSVIIISLDTIRADHLSVYGYGRNTTPNLQKFAAESTVFTRAVASSDMTLPTHASLFTGLYASQHGAHFSTEHRMGAPLDTRFVTLAERLHKSGFWTGGAVANGGT